MAEVIEVASMSPEEARKLTDQVKEDARALWAKLLDLKERGAHVALGYESWADYCAAEFDLGQAQAYRLVQSAEVIKVLERTNTQTKQSVPLPESERVTRELRPLKQTPIALAKTWESTVERHGPKPTAEQVSQVVNETLERAKEARAAAKAANAASAPVKAASAPMPTKAVATVSGDAPAGEVAREPVTTNGDGQAMSPAQAVPEPAPEPLLNPVELSGKVITVSNVLSELDVSKYDLSDGDLTIDLYQALLDMALWTDRAIEAVQANIDKRRSRSRIKKLRSTEGSPEEVKRGTVLADRLESFLET